MPPPWRGSGGGTSGDDGSGLGGGTVGDSGSGGDGGGSTKVLEVDRQLMDAVGGGQLAQVRELLAAGASVNGAADGGITPLALAAHEGRVETVQVLVEANASLDHVVKDLGTALCVAVARNHVEVARVLVEAGADKSITMRGTVTPLEIAQGLGNARMVEVLSGAAPRSAQPQAAGVEAADGERSLSGLSVKQLKDLAREHHVDIVGCTEKSEIVTALAAVGVSGSGAEPKPKSEPQAEPTSTGDEGGASEPGSEPKPTPQASNSAATTGGAEEQVAEADNPIFMGADGSFDISDDASWRERVDMDTINDELQTLPQAEELAKLPGNEALALALYEAAFATLKAGLKTVPEAEPLHRTLREKLKYHTAIADSLRGFVSRGSEADCVAGSDTAHAVEARVSSLEEVASAENDRLSALVSCRISALCT